MRAERTPGLWRRLQSDERGAVYVEFLVAFLPMLIFFECLVQVGSMYTAKLIVLHSAASGARAATVVLHDDPQYYDKQPVGKMEGKRLEDVKAAVGMPLKALRSLVDFEVKFPSQAGGTDSRKQFGRDDLIRVRVDATYECAVPFAKRLVCNPFTKRTTLTAEAALPNNGADYEYGD